MRFTLGVLASVMLGCGGMLQAADLAETPTAAPSLEGPVLLVFDPLQQCEWRLEDLKGHTRVLARTSSCPDVLWMSHDRSQAMALGSGMLWTGPVGALVEGTVPEGVTALWPVGGKPMVAMADYSNEQLRAYTYADGTFAGPKTHPLSENPFEAWDARPPEGAVDAGWWSLGDRVSMAPSKDSMVDDPSAGARAAVLSPIEVTEVGQMRIDGSTLTFKIDFGDTPHPVPPIVWCADPLCEVATPLMGDMPRQLAVFPEGDLALVVTEYSGLQPAVYRAGVAEPVWVGPTGAKAIWADGLSE